MSSEFCKLNLTPQISSTSSLPFGHISISIGKIQDLTQQNADQFQEISENIDSFHALPPWRRSSTMMTHDNITKLFAGYALQGDLTIKSPTIDAQDSFIYGLRAKRRINLLYDKIQVFKREDWRKMKR